MSEYRIHDMPSKERPIEKLLMYGSETLNESELLAILLRSGTKSENVVTLSGKIIGKYQNLENLFDASVDELIQIKGIGTVKAAQIIALSELLKRCKEQQKGDQVKFTNPDVVAEYFMEEMRSLKKEYFRVLMLNTKKVLIGYRNVSIGSLNSSIVHPREVFIEAIRRGADTIIVCHNHPSGDPMPSKSDLDVTSRLKECGELLGIKVIDHIIFGDRRYVSLKEKKLM